MSQEDVAMTDINVQMHDPMAGGADEAGVDVPLVEDGIELLPVPAGPRNVPSHVTVYIMGHDPQHIALDGRTHFLHIRQALVANGVEMANKVLVDESDQVKYDHLPLSNNVPEAGLAAKVQITLYTIHDNMEWSVPVLLASKQTIGTVRANLLAQPQGAQAFAGAKLTWQGVVMQDDQRTDQLAGIQSLAMPDMLTDEERARLRLYGRKYVTVMDIDLMDASQSELTNVTDDMKISEVIKAYQTKERRIHLHQPLVSIYVEGETTADSMQIQPNLNLEETVYNCGIEHNAVLALKTGMFEVILKESAEIEAAQLRNKGVGQAHRTPAANEVPGIRVHIFDWWKVKQLKDAYSALVTDGLSSNDQLFIDFIPPTQGAPPPAIHPDDLNEEKMLYHYGLKPDSILLIKREDFTTTYCMYVCSDCGSDVRLKQRDVVRCRECGHRIVFKRRIAKPCQYLCR